MSIRFSALSPVVRFQLDELCAKGIHIAQRAVLPARDQAFRNVFLHPSGTHRIQPLADDLIVGVKGVGLFIKDGLPPAIPPGAGPELQRHSQKEVSVKGHRLQVGIFLLTIQRDLLVCVQQRIPHTPGLVDLFQPIRISIDRREKMDRADTAMAPHIFHPIRAPELQDWSSAHLCVQADLKRPVAGHEGIGHSLAH